MISYRWDYYLYYSRVVVRVKEIVKDKVFVRVNVLLYILVS